MNEHVKHLEEKIAYLERHVAEQDKAMLEFAEDLARLGTEVRTLRERSIDASQTPDDAEPSDERPPHY